MEKLRRGEPTIEPKKDGNTSYYDIWVPLQMPAGVRSPGGLRLWINPSDWTGLLSGLWHQFILLFALGGVVALLSAFVTTALYTRRFRLISETLRQAEAGTYAARPRYASHDEVGPISAVQRFSLVPDEDGHFPQELDLPGPELLGQGLLVDGFQETVPKLAVDFQGGADDRMGER